VLLTAHTCHACDQAISIVSLFSNIAADVIDDTGAQQPLPPCSAAIVAANGWSCGRKCAGLWLAPLLLAMHARHAFPDAGMAYVAVPVLAACLLAWQARLDWQALRPRSPAPGPAALSP
jgi:hypothetical protein